MEVVILDRADEMAGLVADAVERLFAKTPVPVLGLATGSSPLGVYRELIRRCRSGRLSFAKARAFLLDEYIGLPDGHPGSYRRFIEDNFTGLVDFAAENVHSPDTRALDLDAACADYEAQIAAAGGVDLQLLGIGGDGHIGFNEPTSSLASRTRVKTLTAQTRQDNSRFFAGTEDVPRHVVTQGIGTILQARHLVMLAAGEAKAAPIAAAVEGPVTAMVPASALQLHPHATVVVDAEAASRMRLTDYYRATWAGRPAGRHI